MVTRRDGKPSCIAHFPGHVLVFFQKILRRRAHPLAVVAAVKRREAGVYFRHEPRDRLIRVHGVARLFHLLVLYAAIRKYGVPDAIVSDSGSIFSAKQAQTIYAGLGIRKEQIARRQPWQNYIETHFNIMRRMAHLQWSSAASWAEVCRIHAQFVANYNLQDHWAHQDRAGGQRSPAAVLGWVKGRPAALPRLDHLSYTTHLRRHLDTSGNLRLLNWRLYGEAGLAGEDVDIWLYRRYVDHHLRQRTAHAVPDKDESGPHKNWDGHPPPP